MKTVRVERFGDAAQGVTLRGNPSNPEPEYFIVRFPGGEVCVTRCDDGAYWCHFERNRSDQAGGGRSHGRVGRILDGRIDIEGRHSAEVDCGELGTEGVYHVAVKIGPV